MAKSNQTDEKSTLKKIAVSMILNNRITGQPKLVMDCFDVIDENQAIGRMYNAYDKRDRYDYSINVIATQIV